MAIDNGLIIDVGMHTGKDTEFYLAKGFRVATVEANPRLVDQVRKRLTEAVRSERLTIFNTAISDREGTATFYVNTQKDDWGTLSESFAARNVALDTDLIPIDVECTRFEKILEKTGIPYYLKIDIEGADILCLQALSRFQDKPRYVSIEMSLRNFDDAFSEIALLWVLGYRQFKIVNQALNDTVRCPDPPLEGNYVDARFDGHTSGPFGEEAPGAWMSLDQLLERVRDIISEQALYGAHGRYYDTWRARLNWRYRRMFGLEPVGWYDIHARRGD